MPFLPEIIQQILAAAVLVLEVLAALVIIVGTIYAAGGYVWRRIAGESAEDDFRDFRTGLGRSILIGLEFLIAADIVRTITTDLSPDGLLSLGGLILVRILLSLAIEVEIEGRWPWTRWMEDRREKREE